MKAVTRTGWMGMTRTFNETYEHDFPVPSSTHGTSTTPTDTNDHDDDVDLKDPTTVLIKVFAAGLNPADYKVPKFVFGPVYGLDLCGVVVKVGSQVNEVRQEYQQQYQHQHQRGGCAPLKVGDVVTGCPVKFQHGSLCEYTISPALGVCHIQPDWSIAENAGLNVVCCTFMTALEDAGLRISSLASSSSSSSTKTTTKKPFNSILILGSSGGCGSVALQICKGMGIERIVGVCSMKNVDFCTRLGATEVVCYDGDDDENQTSVEEFCQNPNNIESFDLVYDTVSDGSSSSSSSGWGDYLYESKIRALAKPINPIDSSKPNYLTLNASPYGWLRTMIFGLSPTSGSPRTHIVQARYSCDKLSSAIHFMTVAKQRPVLDDTIIGISPPFTPDSVEEAYKKLKSRRTKGKLVIRICDEEKGGGKAEVEVKSRERG